eukprot:maker-scaffold_4-snap-gene-2.47-mRNA-1 protein AED:0.02 eAED:0.02 QI:107/1/1/1/0/0/2/358/126
MSAIIETINFCDICETLLPTPNHDPIICPCCANKTSYSDIEPRKLIMETTLEEKPEHEWKLELLRKIEREKSGKDKTTKRAIVEEECPRCGHNLASFYTVQLRSVDEGQTVFYECLECKHNWSQNN